MERAQSPISLAKESLFQVVVGCSRDLDVRRAHGHSSRATCLIKSARLSKRPSQVMTTPDSVT